jgi:hypothetical protein
MEDIEKIAIKLFHPGRKLIKLIDEYVDFSREIIEDMTKKPQYHSLLSKYSENAVYILVKSITDGDKDFKGLTSEEYESFKQVVYDKCLQVGKEEQQISAFLYRDKE